MRGKIVRNEKKRKKERKPKSVRVRERKRENWNDRKKSLEKVTKCEKDEIVNSKSETRPIRR